MKKKFLKIWQRIFRSTLPEAEILKKRKKIFENLATNFRAVTSADAHVTIFSVLLLPEQNIDKKQKKIFLILAKIIVRKCPRDYFQRSTCSRCRDIDKKQKKNFLKIWQRIIRSTFTRRKDIDKNEKNF
ncbi:hypothetical protein PUN28_016945 [Cardiocondyla obscurior]|uniref:Uncharacterized protein n=1 Tax=Cardiocondyla obscurior TaxID=286306 RepID=A0AAW2ELR3_9HYME